jgi:hypothetical protein
VLTGAALVAADPTPASPTDRAAVHRKMTQALSAHFFLGIGIPLLTEIDVSRLPYRRTSSSMSSQG